MKDGRGNVILKRTSKCTYPSLSEPARVRLST